MEFLARKEHWIHKRNPNIPKLLESYCPGCGLLIAASPLSRILRIMEKLHTCPVYFRYPQNKQQRVA